tara:strand:+ start:1144 stop:2067 length:924 start_codon:yes stop_codon:yes gene_type:complete
MREEIITCITKLASKNKKVVLITADLGFGVFDEFQKRFPDQFINVGVAEQNMSTIACGMALEGYKVFTYSIANFPTLRCLEQIRNDICYHNADVTIISTGAGFSYGALGVSHFATEDIAILNAIPNLKLLIPADEIEAKKIFEDTVNMKCPKYLRLDKTNSGFFKENEFINYGKARIIKEGNDVTIVSIGGILKEAIKAHYDLKNINISTRIISLNTLSPLDSYEVFKACRETNALITLEEHVQSGGLSSIIASECLKNNIYPKKFIPLSLPDKFPSIVGDQSYLRNIYKIDSEAIIDVIRNLKNNF